MFKKFLTFFGILLICGSANAQWKSKAKRKAADNAENYLENKLQNTEVTITSTERNKPEFEIITVQPLTDVDSNVTFIQGSALRHDGDRETVNLGLGHRTLVADDSIMLGVNAFYDYELDYDHTRSSLGAEIRSSILELNTNYYFKDSGQKNGKNSITEEAVDGYDYELGGHIPYIPTWKLFAKQFEWDMPNQKDLEGQEYSTEILVPSTGLTVTAGHTNYSNHKDNWFVSLSYNLGKVNADQPFIQDQAYEMTAMNDMMLKKVRRENKIIKKKGSGFSVLASGF